MDKESWSKAREEAGIHYFGLPKKPIRGGKNQQNCRQRLTLPTVQPISRREGGIFAGFRANSWCGGERKLEVGSKGRFRQCTKEKRENANRVGGWVKSQLVGREAIEPENRGCWDIPKEGSS